MLNKANLVHTVLLKVMGVAPSGVRTHLEVPTGPYFGHGVRLSYGHVHRNIFRDERPHYGGHLTKFRKKIKIRYFGNGD